MTPSFYSATYLILKCKIPSKLAPPPVRICVVAAVADVVVALEFSRFARIVSFDRSNSDDSVWAGLLVGAGVIVAIMVVVLPFRRFMTSFDDDCERVSHTGEVGDVRGDRSRSLGGGTGGFCCCC